MPFTPEQQAKIREKEASLPDALKRDPLVNYYEGYFFVTLNTRDEVPVLGLVEGTPGAAEGSGDEPHVRYSQLGQKVMDVWASVPQFHPNVEAIAYEVMPEHTHALLRLSHGNRKHLGHIIGGIMSACTHAYWDTLGIDWHKNRYDNSAAARLSPDRDRDHTRSFRGPALFVRGYNDVEPITPEQVQIKIDYIHSQAERRLIKGTNHQCFRISRQQHSRNWHTERITRAITADPYFARNVEKRETAVRNILTHLSYNPPSPTTYHPTPTHHPSPATQHPSPALDYLGNRAIMAAANKLPLICHRADAVRFAEQKAKVLDAARKGAVIVSAFISPKERDIRTQLMVELLPFIEIMDNGFSEKYKPVGKAFYAVAENRLVQITPWTYKYQKDGVQVSREMCMVMNELARVISGREDEWWK